MLYSATLTSIRNGEEFTFVGSREEMEALASRNGVNFRAKVAPATDEEILDQVAKLDDSISYVRSKLENAPWSSGPRYRAEIDGYQRKRRAILSDMPSHLSARVA